MNVYGVKGLSHKKTQAGIIIYKKVKVHKKGLLFSNLRSLLNQN